MSEVPEWISASAALVALIFAGLAARWTARSATAAGQQVEAAKAQVEAAEAQIKLAEAAAARQQDRAAQAEARAGRAELREREQLEAAEERFQKVQLDARAPAVYFAVKAGYDGSEAVVREGRNVRTAPPLAALPREAAALLRDPHADLDRYARREPVGIPRNEQYFFVITASVEVVNVSANPARIDIVDSAGFEFYGDFNFNFFVVPPGERRLMVGSRYVHTSELVGDSGMLQFENVIARVRFWVRDLAMETCDVHVMTLDLRFFEADGSRITVNPTPAFSWWQVAEQVPPRSYPRIEAAKSQPEVTPPS